MCYCLQKSREKYHATCRREGRPALGGVLECNGGVQWWGAMVGCNGGVGLTNCLNSIMYVSTRERKLSLI